MNKKVISHCLVEFNSEEERSFECEYVCARNVTSIFTRQYFMKDLFDFSVVRSDA